MSGDRVTVVIPTHNRRRMLARTLASVLRQRWPDFEVVVVDDGSSDGTVGMLQSLDDSRVRWVRHDTPRGVSASRNRGIEEADGHWIAFLDDDDLWSPTKLASQLEVADGAGSSWVYSGAVAVNERLVPVAGGAGPDPPELLAELPYRNLVPSGASNVMVRTEVVRACGGFDTGLRHMADWDLWIRLAQQGSPAGSRRVDVAYVLHSGSASFAVDEIPRELQIMEDRYAHLRTGPIDRPDVYRWIGWSSLRARRRRNAFKAYMKAARHGDPLSMLRALVGAAYPAIAMRVIRRHLRDPADAAEASRWIRQFLDEWAGGATAPG